jgi:hypothetical protein
MSKITTSIIIALFVGIALLYIEYCYFDTENCPVHAATLTDTQASVDCPKTRGVNDELVDDCQPITPLPFKINYLYRPQGQGDFYPFGDGSVLHSGDSLKLLFTPTEDAYVYIFMVDSHGQIARLLPKP